MDQLFNNLYSKKVMEHFRNPKNMGVIKNPDGMATVGNPRCGDLMKFYIRVGKDKQGRDYFKEVKFQTLGCGAAIATSSMVTTLVKGKPLTEAENVTKQVIAEALGGLPAVKMHCSVLADEGIRKAVKNYYLKQTSKK